MSLQEKVSQLFMVHLFTNECEKSLKSLEETLKEYPVGGVLFMAGTVEKQRLAYQKIQQLSSIPLLTAIDGEWGLNMRLPDAVRFPRNLALAALSDPSPVYEMGREVAKQCKHAGVHLNFAPVVDINNNPKNPVISDRSFGEDVETVTKLGLLFMQGMQKEEILACAKHFPGHGDTHQDSHLHLPTIHKSLTDLEEFEWRPFKALIENGLSSVMSAHLLIPEIDHKLPASLSKAFVTDHLKGQLHFDGLIFTDHMEMKAIADHHEPAHAEFLAIKAGSDMVIHPKDLGGAIHYICHKVKKNELTEAEIDKHVLKILRAKQKLNLHKNPNLSDDYNKASALKLKKRLYSEIITCCENKKAQSISGKKKVAFVQIGRDVLMKSALEVTHESYEKQYPETKPPLYTSLKKEVQVDYFFLPKSTSFKLVSDLVRDLQGYDQIVVGVYEMNKFYSKNYGICPSTINFLEKIRDKQVYLSLFGSPYSLKDFENQNLILMAYENDVDAQVAVAQILLGKQKAVGKLPISASKKYPINTSRSFP